MTITKTGIMIIPVVVPQSVNGEVRRVAQSLRITTTNEFGDFQVVLDGHVIPDVAAYTLQEGHVNDDHTVYTRKLTLEILLGLTREVEVQR